MDKRRRSGLSCTAWRFMARPGRTLQVCVSGWRYRSQPRSSCGFAGLHDSTPISLISYSAFIVATGHLAGRSNQASRAPLSSVSPVASQLLPLPCATGGQVQNSRACSLLCIVDEVRLQSCQTLLKRRLTAHGKSDKVSPEFILTKVFQLLIHKETLTF